MMMSIFDETSVLFSFMFVGCFQRIPLTVREDSSLLNDSLCAVLDYARGAVGNSSGLTERYVNGVVSQKDFFILK